MKIAVVGATGLVGREMVRVLEEHHFPAETLIPVATPESYGKIFQYRGKSIQVTGHAEAISNHPEIALFSAGADVSREWAPRYNEVGTTVIDNSSAWRMTKDIPLIVPEINARILTREHKIIANPNCSTVQLVLVLAPIYHHYGIRRVVVATYQSVTGTGAKAVRQMECERKGIPCEKIYPHPIDLNLFPHGGSFLANGYTTEEMKLVNESRKILDDPSLAITSTIVRVPVLGGHSEAVNVETIKDFDLNDLRRLLADSPGLVLMDEPEKNIYPMPIISHGKDEVFVGRIRRDESLPNALNLFIVADNLRKGAATNAVQIARYLTENELC